LKKIREALASANQDAFFGNRKAEKYDFLLVPRHTRGGKANNIKTGNTSFEEKDTFKYQINKNRILYKIKNK
jgi:hypothetical protein